MKIGFYVPVKQNVFDDIARQLNKFTGAANSLLERFARGYEELDGNRLALEEIRELLKEYFEEASLWANGISRRVDRLEQYIVLSRMGDTEQAASITQQVKGEHIRRRLREELGVQQELLQQYQRNIDRVKLKIAKYGETVPLMNELDGYQLEVDKITEGITRMRDALK